MTATVHPLPQFRNGSSNRRSGSEGDVLHIASAQTLAMMMIRKRLRWPKSLRPNGDRSFSDEERELLYNILREFLERGEAQRSDQVVRRLQEVAEGGMLNFEQVEAIYSARHRGAYVQLRRHVYATACHRMQTSQIGMSDEQKTLTQMAVFLAALVVRPHQWQDGYIQVSR